MNKTGSTQSGGTGITGDLAIQPGDILLKQSDGESINTLIKMGQIVSKGDRSYVHAAIVSDISQEPMRATVIESSGEGLDENDLLTTNAAYTYAVFRSKVPDLALGACETAKMLIAGITQGGFRIGYSKSGALCSLLPGTTDTNTDHINEVLDDLLQNHRQDFFCSGFVVWCYIVAIQQTKLLPLYKQPAALSDFQKLFALTPDSYNPSFLFDKLLKSPDCFENRGLVRAGRATA